MSEKTRIIAALGERRILVPALINGALAANDRAKYRLTLLQSCKAHADFPGDAFSSLRTERLACGITDSSYDDVITGAVKRGSDEYVMPHLSKVCEGLVSDLRAMISSFEVAEKPEAELFNKRFDELSNMLCRNTNNSITGKTIISLASGEPANGDRVH